MEGAGGGGRVGGREEGWEGGKVGVGGDRCDHRSDSIPVFAPGWAC